VLLGAYFDGGYFWRDVEHVLALTIPDLELYLRQAHRIAAARQKANG
jgi:hypothetical protein